MQLTISQPEKWIEAFRAEAKRKNMPLAKWIGLACIKQLPADVRQSLPDRPPAHRPRKRGAMAQDKPGEPINFFLNEQHELAREDRGGGGRLAEYVGINWGTKGQQLSSTLKSAATTVEKSNDPLKGKRYFLLAMPEPHIDKEPYFGGSHGRVFSRLGIDLIDVGPSGEAIVHATPERLQQLVARAASLARLGQREQNRWAAIESFSTIPLQFRVDSDWLAEVKGQPSADTVVEFQPLLTRLEADTLLRAISGLIREGSEKLAGTGTDFTGRYWVRGKLTPKTIKTLATDFFSVQSIHPPQYSVAGIGKACIKKSDSRVDFSVAGDRLSRDERIQQ